MITGRAGSKNLWYRIVSDYVINVESQSETLGYHTVRKVRTGNWVCDSTCMGYRVRYSCAHTETAEAAEAIHREERRARNLQALKEIYAEVNG
jgi:hypothetical protein